MAVPSSAAAQVFVSYASRDRQRVFLVNDHLESAGIRSWLDRKRIDGGTIWAEEIVKGIRTSKVLVLMCSDAAMRSRAVKQEIQLAWKYELAYLPLLLEATHFPEQMEFFLEGCQWIELLDHPPQEWMPSIVRALQRAGVECSVPALTAEEVAPSVQPTRLGYGLKGLRSVARLTDCIWPLVVQDRVHVPHAVRYTVRDLGAPQEGVQHRIRLGSQVFWAIEWDEHAHLLLLDEGPEGKTYCLCPSWFVPDTGLHPGLNLLPPDSAGCEPFVLTGVPGREHLLAIITGEPLDLEWMPADPSVPARVLDQADVDLLVSLLGQMPAGSWTALATYCDVVV